MYTSFRTPKTNTREDFLFILPAYSGHGETLVCSSRKRHDASSGQEPCLRREADESAK